MKSTYSLGRINVTWIYNAAKKKDPSIGNKEAHRWLVPDGVKKLRSNYQTLLGFDPVNTIKGGQRKNSQTRNNGFENTTQVISDNGNVQTGGIYLIDRLFITYAAWVSFDFRVYVDDIVLRNSNNIVSAQSLILPTDKLHRENNDINARHSRLIIEASKVPQYLKYPGTCVRDIQGYVEWLRESYNINITVPEFLKWLCYIGVFYKDSLKVKENIGVYYPKQEYTTSAYPVFLVGDLTFEGKVIRYTHITPYGHDSLIKMIVDHFGQIKKD